MWQLLWIPGNSYWVFHFCKFHKKSISFGCHVISRSVECYCNIHSLLCLIVSLPVYTTVIYEDMKLSGVGVGGGGVTHDCLLSTKQNSRVSCSVIRLSQGKAQLN